MQVWNSTLVSFYLLLDKIDGPDLVIWARLLVGWCKTFYQKCQKGISDESNRIFDPGRECKGWSWRKLWIKIFGSQTKGAKSVQNKEQEKNILLDFWSSNKMCKIGAKKGAGDKYQSQFLDLRQKFQNSMVLDVGLSFNSNRCLK